MTPDKIYAIFAGLVVLGITGIEKYSPSVLEFLLALTRPGATLLLLSVIAFLYMKNLHLTAMVASAGVILLLRTLWTSWPRSDARRLHLEIGKDLARFESANSIDLQFANGSVKHNMPHLIAPVQGFEELLVFPPSSKTLHEMCG